MKKNFKLIVTLGEALISSPEKLKKIDSLGDCIYRINGAHVLINSLHAIIKNLRKILQNPKIILDLPCNKVRTKALSDPIHLSKGETFELHDYMINYPKFYQHLKIGDLILAKDSTLTLEVAEINGPTIKILSHSDGLLENNKGLHVQGLQLNIPFLFQNDSELIKVACNEDLDYISLSFVRTAEDIKNVKKILRKYKNTTIQIFAKVETALAVDNLESILEEVDNINIDRGDLSADVGLLKLPTIQEYIIKVAKKARKNIYVATQLLKNMEKNPVPLIAEVIDLHSTIKSGVSGIQLSEETAVGKYPVECVKLVFDILNRFSSEQN